MYLEEKKNQLYFGAVNILVTTNHLIFPDA